MQPANPNTPYGEWAIAACIYCRAESDRPHERWCRASLWSRTGADHTLIWRTKGRVPARR